MLSNQYKERDLVLSNIISNNNKNEGAIDKKQIEALPASEQVPSPILKTEQQRQDQGPNDMFKSVKTEGGEWMDATEEHLKNKEAFSVRQQKYLASTKSQQTNENLRFTTSVMSQVVATGKTTPKFNPQ